MADESKLLAENRKARHEYFIEDRLEGGLMLVGSEVKSIKAGRANLKEAYLELRNDELWLIGCHIALYPYANAFGHTDPVRRRKVLLHRKELERLRGLVQRSGYTLVPLTLYAVRGLIKIQIGTAKGKKQFDKRDDLKRRTAEREAQRDLKMHR